MRRWGYYLAAAVLTAGVVAGCGPAPTAAPAAKAPAKHGFIVTGTAKNIYKIDPVTYQAMKIPYDPAGNTFIVAVGPRHRRAFVPDMAGHVYVLNLKTGATIAVLPAPKGADIARFTPNGKELWVTGASKQGVGFTEVYNPATLKLIKSIPGVGPENIKGFLVFSTDGKYAFISGFHPMHYIDVVDTKTFKLITKIPGGGYVDGVLQPDGKLLWGFNIYTGIVHLISTTSLKQVGTIAMPSEACPYWNPSIGTKFFTGYMQGWVGPGGQHMYNGAYDGRVVQFNIAKQQVDGSIWVHDPQPAPSPKNHFGNPHLAQINGMVWGPRGEHIWASLGGDKAVVVLDPKTGHVTHVFHPMMSPRFTVVSY
ncbi:MAG: hypothetical protein M0031_05085 [Thermaerobacter sp.]|nr:hypothetical protein [Thermaerobacter sp.]